MGFINQLITGGPTLYPLDELPEGIQVGVPQLRLDNTTIRLPISRQTDIILTQSVPGSLTSIVRYPRKTHHHEQGERCDP